MKKSAGMVYVLGQWQRERFIIDGVLLISETLQIERCSVAHARFLKKKKMDDVLIFNKPEQNAKPKLDSTNSAN